MKVTNGNINPNSRITLESLFANQIQFQRTVERLVPSVNLPFDDVDKFIYHVTALQEEIGEVLKADKRWKTHRNTTYEKFEKLDELADCWITLMNITMWSGIELSTMLETINYKIIENNKRLVEQERK